MSGSDAAVPREELHHFRRLGRELATVIGLHHARIAERMGLSGTDHKCLELVLAAETPLTAGHIATLSGLSTGAVTGVIDRLERRGFVRRVRDPHDRRKVLVEVARFDEADRAGHARLAEEALDLTERVLARFTPDERAVVERYLRASIGEHHRILERD
jgi:DNA-binding MarR family transcriptional regulator